MPFQQGREPQVVRIPLRHIDEHYGRDNHDNAGDDLVCCLRLATEKESELRYEFAFSIEHHNPWHHTMDFIIEKIEQSTYERLIELLVAFALTED